MNFTLCKLVNYLGIIFFIWPKQAKKILIFLRKSMEIFYVPISLVLVHSRHPTNRTNLQIIAWEEQTEPLREERFMSSSFWFYTETPPCIPVYTKLHMQMQRQKETPGKPGACGHFGKELAIDNLLCN